MSSLLLFPGAGSDREHPALVAIDRAVAELRPAASIVRADFPYRRAGRRAPDRAPVLLQAVHDEVAALPPGPVVLGGRSMGGRMCSLAAAGVSPDGVELEPLARRVAGLVLVSYPLHPPGKPDRLRVEHLPRLTVPCLFVHGTNDAFGSPDELQAWTATIAGPVDHVWIERGTHELRRADTRVAEAVVDWLRRRRLLTRAAGGARPRG
jgi:uncharacterized protein